MAIKVPEIVLENDFAEKVKRFLLTKVISGWQVLFQLRLFLIGRCVSKL